MPDLSLSVTVSRDLLGLGALELNDHDAYYCAPFTPGGVTWERISANGVFVEGDITVHRRRANVTESLVLEVNGDSQAELSTNLAALLQAFVQDSFNIDINVGGTHYQWACEAADYQVTWDGPRFIARRLQVTLGIPRKPLPAGGPF